MQIECLPKFGPLIQKRKRVKILVGGRASTKTTFVADYVSSRIMFGKIWCCAREFQNSIDESVHRTLVDEVHSHEMPGFRATKTRLEHESGGYSFYQGLARNITSIKGMLSGVDGLWIEEGENLSENTLRVLTASLRVSPKEAREFLSKLEQGNELYKKGRKWEKGEITDDEFLHMMEEYIELPEMWITMNRGSRNDPVAKRFLARAEKDLAAKGYYEDDYMIVVQANYDDMPKKWWLASGLESERADDYEKMNRAQYRHKWHGDYLEDAENAIIQSEWFDAAIDAHKKLGGKGWEPRGVKVVTHDPSDLGEDDKGLCYRHGNVILDVQAKDNGDVNDGCFWATDYARMVQADIFGWDCDGIGLGLKLQVSQSFEGTHVKTFQFRGSESVRNPEAVFDAIDNSTGNATNKDYFCNRRAQCYWELRQRFYDTFRAITKGEYIDPDRLISISSDIDCIDALRAEVCRIPLKQNSRYPVQILGKVDMKKLDMPSPNLADSLMMSFDAPNFVNMQNTSNVRMPKPIRVNRRGY